MKSYILFVGRETPRTFTDIGEAEEAADAAATIHGSATVELVTIETEEEEAP